MKIQPRHATYVALGVSVLLLIAGAVMLGIGVSKLNKSNNNKCSSPPNLNNGVPQASDAYFQVLLSSSAVNVSDIHSNYANASESIRQSFQNAIGNANQAPPGVTILLLAESSFGNDTSVCYASAAFMQGKAPKMSVLRSRLASVAEEVYNVYDSTSMSNQNNFANMCQDPHSSQNCKSKCTPCIPKPVCSTKAQVLLVVDTSADNSQLQFNQLLSFLSQDLVTQWPLDFFSVWVAGYPESLNNEGHTFEGYTLRQLQDMIQVNSIRNSNSAASVTNALNYTLMLLTGQSPSVVIFMTASTDKADFASAATPAGALKNAGNKLITLGWGPSVDNTDLTKLASPGSAFQLTSTAGANPDLGKKMTMTICNGSTSTTTASPTTPTTTTIVPVTSSTTPCGTVGGSPCDQRLLVIFDTSSDLSATEYTNQQNFITNNLIDPIWNNFDRFALGSFGQYTQFTGFGELHTRNEVVGFVTHTYQSKNPSSVKMALHSVREDVGVKKMTIVLFVGSKNTADIQAAQHFFHQMHTYTNLVIVAFPGADTASLKNISNTVIPWNNPSDVSRYGSLNGQIMAALNISCGCSGTSTPPVTSTTTTPIGRITLTPTPTGQTCSPSSGGPCNQKLLIIMDTSSHVSDLDYANQQSFITNTLVDPKWTNFDRFSVGSYDTYVQLGLFGELHSRSDVAATIKYTRRVKDAAPDLRKVMQSIKEGYGDGDLMTIVFFSGSKDVANIQTAQEPFNEMIGYANVVIVAFPGADITALQSISNELVPWPNPSDSNKYGDLNNKIMVATKLNCTCVPPQATTTTPGGSTTTGPTGPTPTGPTPTGPTCVSSGTPCNGRLAIVVDVSADVSASDFANQQKFITSTLIDPNWTKFDDLMIAAHDDYAQFNAFGEIHNLNEATGLVSHSFQSQDLPSLSRFFRSLKEKFGGEDMSLVIFSANKNPAEIQSAFPAYRLIADSMNVVMVGMPGAASNLNILGQTYVPWANPGDSSGYGDLKNKIMAGTKLNCTCVPPTATTTTSVGPGKSTTTGPTGPTPTGPTPTGPTVTPTPCTNPGSPCNQKFFVIFDTSTDISRANYANQQNFITTSLIEPSWTNFDQFNLWSYNKYVTDNGFTEYHQRSDVVGAIRNTNQSNVYVPNIRRLYESLAAKYAGVYMSVVIFSATNNTQDIKDAACFFNKLEKSTRIVMVGMPAADPSLATIAHAYVSWENLGNSAGYSAKASEIMKDTRLKCGCQGTPKPTPPQGTTATPGGSGCQPCSTPLALMMDHSIDISKETYKAQQYFLTKSFISSNWVNFDQYSFIAYDYYMDPQMFGEFKNRSDVVKEIMVPQSEDNYSSIRRLYETMIKAYGEKKMTAVIFAGTNNTKDVRAAGLLHQTLHKTMNIVIIAFPGAAKNLGSLGYVVDWPNPTDPDSYDGLTHSILAAAKLNCNCPNTPTPPPGSTTTTVAPQMTSTTPTSRTPGTTATPGSSCPGFEPCNKKLALFVDTSSDISNAIFVDQKNFIVNSFVNPSWTNFNQFSYNTYDSGVQMNGFGEEIHSRSDLIEAVQNLTFHSANPNDMRELMRTLAQRYKNDRGVTVIFTANNDPKNIKQAVADYQELRKTMKVVIVAMPGAAAKNLKAISAVTIPWTNPSDTSSYGSFNRNLKTAMGLTCKATCAPTTPSSSTTTVSGPSTSSTTQSSTTSSGSTTSSSAVTTPSTPSQPTPSVGPNGCRPCSKKLALLMDTSAEISYQNFQQQSIFISSSLIDPNWNNFEQFIFGSYNDYIDLQGISELKTWDEVTGIVANTNQSGDVSSLRTLMHRMSITYKDEELAAVIFSGSNSAADIAAAQEFYDLFKTKINVVMVALPNFHPNLANIAGTLIPWENPSDNTKFGNLRDKIIRATGLNCSCLPPTTTSPAPSNGQFPYSGNIAIMIDGSSDLTEDQFDDQRSFLSNELFGTKWTAFNRFALGSYASGPSDLRTFGSFQNQQDVLKYIVNIPHAKSAPNLRLAAESVQQMLIQAEVSGPTATIILTNCKNKEDIGEAKASIGQLSKLAQVVIVTLPDTDPSIGILAESAVALVPWKNPNSDGSYKGLMDAILYDSKLPYTGSGVTIPTTAPTTSPATQKPCSGKLMVFFDASADITKAQYKLQSTFIAYNLFSADWTDYNRFAIGAYATHMENFNSFGTLSSRNDIINAVQTQELSKELGDLTLLLEELNHNLQDSQNHGAKLDPSTTTVLIFVNTLKKDTIEGAKRFVASLSKLVNLVLVTMPGTDKSISDLLPAKHIVPWPQMGSEEGYEVLKNAILQASSMKCS